jgi:hypothetical protein
MRNFHMVDGPIRWLQDRYDSAPPRLRMRLSTPEQLREEMKRLVRRAAEPARAGESVKVEVGRAARVLGLSYGRVKRYWYGEIQVPPAHEVDAIRAAVAGRERASVPPSAPASVAAQIHVVYDENGRVWPANSPELREGLGYTTGDFDVGGFAVRCLGWVEVRHVPGRIHVRIAPRVMQPKAMDMLFQLLATAPKVEVVLAVRVGHVWEEEIQPSATAAAGRIEVLVRGPNAEGGQRFVTVRQPITMLFRDKNRFLIDILQRARTLHSGASLDAVIRFAESDVAGRTGVAVGTLSSNSSKTRTWRVGHIGRALTLYADAERQRLIGTDLADGPDGEYGRWCQLGYDGASETGEPYVEDIRALVFRLHGPPLEARYRRLLVPLTGASGECYVLCTTQSKQPLAA